MRKIIIRNMYICYNSNSPYPLGRTVNWVAAYWPPRRCSVDCASVAVAGRWKLAMMPTHSCPSTWRVAVAAAAVWRRLRRPSAMCWRTLRPVARCPANGWTGSGGSAFCVSVFSVSAWCGIDLSLMAGFCIAAQRALFSRCWVLCCGVSFTCLEELSIYSIHGGVLHVNCIMRSLLRFWGRRVVKLAAHCAYAYVCSTRPYCKILRQFFSCTASTQHTHNYTRHCALSLFLSLSLARAFRKISDRLDARINRISVRN